MLTLIVARAANGAIGKDGDIPWHAPEDLAMFQRETRGGAIIMGRKTWVSLPVKPLKGRMNCVISRDTSLTEHVFAKPEAAIEAAYAAGYHRVYGIGGAGIYQAMLPMADRLMITEVETEVIGADAFFPDFEDREWREVSARILRDRGPKCTLRELMNQNVQNQPHNY
ncbi:dihydrofolate reductase [Maritimibacter dapengensis]|uniref:Dihydrofolate reductase n=1 Tax=Maritimibacter dapengensis TaxID=2836868 RepID=A0ABS6T0Y1_9RHOB|nr:dihydrofolate reductase [Maritimibacter dapengensis]MBV7378221.1 dihydrofolate reductase [Maritimibacter dapengensis]